MPAEQLEHVSTRLGLRAPRVALVFDAGHEGGWLPLARDALGRANEFWGGVGFVLVPHVDGTVSGEVLRVLRAYDPDFVVPFEPAPRRTEPDSDEVGVFDADPRDRRRLATASAVESVALACSPHRRWLSPEEDPLKIRRTADSSDQRSGPAFDTLPWHADLIGWDLDHTHLGHHSGGPLTPLSALDIEGAMWLHSPPSLTGALGLALAARVGSVVDQPNNQPPPLRLDLDQEVASTDADDIVGYLTGPSDEWTSLPPWLAYHPAGYEFGVGAASQPAAWTRSMSGLTHLVSGLPLKPVRHVVVGDSADDFALFVLLDRTYGNAVWLHSSWAPLGKGPWAGAAARALRLLLTNAGRGRGYDVVVTSISVSSSELEPLIADGGPLHEVATHGWFAGDSEEQVPPPRPRRRQDRSPRVRVERQVKLPERGRLLLAVGAEFERRVSLPATVSAAGRITLTSSLEPISPSDPTLARCATLSWQVDVDLHRPRHEEKPLQMPFGRGLDGHALVPTEYERHETWVRSSRSGITFDSRRYDFVPAGAIGDQRLARPRLQRLDLGSWIDALARQGGWRTEASDAGTRADLLADMWGGRAALAKAFSGPFRTLIDKFSQTGDSTKVAYPDGDGILLPGSIGVLKYSGLSAPWSGNPAESVREILDDLVVRGVIRRGLVLRCSACRNLGFVDIDALAGTNICGRCGGVTPLRLAAWRHPVSDPEWFYELHPIVRDLVRDNGQAPLWLAHHLRQGAHSYSDVSETNLLRGNSRKPLAEADLVAYADGRLVTAEVKTTDERVCCMDR